MWRTLLFYCRETEQEVFLHFFRLLEQKSLVKLVCPPSTHNNLFTFEDFGFVPVARLQYRYKSIQPIPDYINNTEYQLLPVTKKNIHLCNWYALFISICGDMENYHKSCIGLILWDKDNERVASEAHGVVANDLVEIGTTTHEAYRGKKLSTIVCNRLIQDSIKQGLHPIWTCDESNMASRKVAEHQCMNHKTAYTFYTLKK